jgi:hypothetical protein
MHFAEAYPPTIDFVQDLDFSRVSLRAIVCGHEADSVDPQILIIVHFDFNPRFIVLSHAPFVIVFVTIAQQVLRIFATGSATTWRCVFGLDSCIRANI